MWNLHHVHWYANNPKYVTQFLTDSLGRGEQTQSLSWWPPHVLWISSGMYTGIWTPQNEHWFTARLADIHAGAAQPKNYKDWKNSLRLHSETRALGSAMDEYSRVFVNDHFVQTHHRQ